MADDAWSYSGGQMAPDAPLNGKEEGIEKNVRINKLNGDVINIPVQLSSTIGSLKALIGEREEKHAFNLQLFNLGNPEQEKPLEDFETIANQYLAAPDEASMVELTFLLIVSIGGICISGHADETYNGEYIQQGDKLINGKVFYVNPTCNVTLYFWYDPAGIQDGQPGWHLDSRAVEENEGKPNWFDIGWLDFTSLGQYKYEVAPPEGTHDFYIEGANALTLTYM